MLDTVKRTIFDYMMLETGENVLVALSGGADSAALLLSLRELGYPVRAFHLNHCLRGAESDRDEAFCRRLCEKLGVELTVERVDIAAAAGDSAVEETARRIRYARLEHAAHGAKIAVAHNADDNLETMLFHLVRGTGAKGLMGIPPVRGRIIPKAETAVERPEIPLTLPFAGTIWKDTVKLAAKKLEKSEVFYKTFNTFCLDCGTIDFESLCVRTRRTGDTLRLTENGGSRSLKKLMIDRKIPRYMRNAMAVIADKNGVIAVQDIGADCSRTAKNNANTLQITVKGLSKNGL